MTATKAKEKRDVRVSGRIKPTISNSVESFIARNDNWSMSDCIQKGLELFLKKYAK